VANKVASLIRDTPFGSRAQHSLSHWDPKDADAADALADALFYCYRNYQAVLDGNVVLPAAGDQAPSAPPTPGAGASSSSRGRAPTPSPTTVTPERVRGELQKLLRRLHMSQPSPALSSQQDPAALLATAPQELVTPFMQLLAQYNGLGLNTGPTNTLRARLSPYLEPL
jgi:hypothetical protein